MKKSPALASLVANKKGGRRLRIDLKKGAAARLSHGAACSAVVVWSCCGRAAGGGGRGLVEVWRRHLFLARCWQQAVHVWTSPNKIEETQKWSQQISLPLNPSSWLRTSQLSADTTVAPFLFFSFSFFFFVGLCAASRRARSAVAACFHTAPSLCSYRADPPPFHPSSLHLPNSLSSGSIKSLLICSFLLI